MIPYINNKPTYTLTIPELSGGINLRDGISLVKDNQLTDCKNVWYKDGGLRTRPRVLSGDDIGNTTRAYGKAWVNKAIVYKNIKFIEDSEFDIQSGDKEGGTSYLVAYNDVIYDGVGNPHVQIGLDFINENDPRQKHFVDSLLFQDENGVPDEYQYNPSFFLFQHNGDLYLFLSRTNVDATKKDYRIYKFSYDKTSKKWNKTEIKEEDAYAPLVATNGKPGLNNGFIGSMINGYNLLGCRYKMEFSTHYETTAETDNSEGAWGLMNYTLLHSVEDCDNYRTVSATYVDINGNQFTHTVNATNDTEINYEIHEEQPKDGLTMAVSGRILRFYEYGTTNIAKVYNKDFVKNNMTVTAPCPNSNENKNKVFNMTRAEWFGGTAEGIYGGTRLFLGGNTTEGEQALVVWSDLNNPLYFSENNYTYVGDKSQAVTTFGRQSDRLFIFKERELFATYYVLDASVTSEDIINQSVVDLSVQIAKFPMVQVHGYIGCDCPDTVQLCRNRLVWANSNGKVYTLVSQSQYNEHSIYEVSEMIERKLKQETNLKNAHSADYNGYYMLVVDDKAYVMDYNSYGYTHITSYLKSEDANINVPWYYWELPIKPDAVGVAGDFLFFPYLTKAGEYDVSQTEKGYFFSNNILYMDGSYGKDEVKILVNNTGNPENYADMNDWELTQTLENIHTVVQTKLFDFGQPSVLKSVPSVHFSFEYNNGEPITVRFISETQTADEHSVTLNGASAEQYSPECMQSCRLFPYTKGTVRFGARIECDGELMIDSLSLQYKVLGGAK